MNMWPHISATSTSLGTRTYLDTPAFGTGYLRNSSYPQTGFSLRETPYFPSDVSPFVNPPSLAHGQKDILILGNAYTPHRDADYNGIKYRQDELTHDLCQSMKGLDVFIEHDDSRCVGKVIDAYVNCEGNLMTFLHVTGDPLCNTYLPEKLSKNAQGKRYFNDLSLGHEVMLQEQDGFTKVVGKTPVEVSIVQQGDNPGTHIYDWWFVQGTSGDILRETIPTILHSIAHSQF